MKYGNRSVLTRIEVPVPAVHNDVVTALDAGQRFENYEDVAGGESVVLFAILRRACRETGLTVNISGLRNGTGNYEFRIEIYRIVYKSIIVQRS